MCKLFCNSLRDFKLLLLAAVFTFSKGQLKPVLVHVGEYHQIFAKVSLANTSCIYLGKGWGNIQVSKQNSWWQSFLHGHLPKVAIFYKSLKCNCGIWRVVLPHPNISKQFPMVKLLSIKEEVALKEFSDRKDWAVLNTWWYDCSNRMN